MNYKLFYLKVTTLILLFTLNTLGQDWLWKIAPMQTNVSQVKEMFKVVPEIYGKDRLLFKLREGNLFIDYSKGKCVKTYWGRWNVEEGIILDIKFYPKKGRKPSFYKLKKEGMQKGFDQGHITYASDELGLYYSTQFGKVSGIHIYPAKKYDNLKCEGNEVSSN